VYSPKRNIKTLLRKLTGKKFFVNKIPELDTIRRVLVISLYFKGDVLFHTAVLAAAKHLLPSSKIDFWVKSRAADVLESDPAINELLVFDNVATSGYRERTKLDLSGKLRFLKKLRAEKYDLIIDLTGKYSTALFTLFSGSKYSIGLNYNYFGFCYDHFANIDTSVEPGNLIQKYFRVLLEGISLNDSMHRELSEKLRPKPYLYIDNQAQETIEKLLKEMFQSGMKPLITIHLSSGWPAKELPVSVFSDLIKEFAKLNFEYLFVGTEDDRPKLRQIETLLHLPGRSLDKRLPKLRFKETAELIRRSDVFVGSDSAPLHLAGAVSTPSVGLFGPTNPEFSNPMGDKHKVIYHRIICSSAEHEQYCTRNGGFTCPLYECMNSITATDIMTSIAELLKLNSREK
jgi:ADP-heptose:LPS heptosyltransferase